MNCNPSHSAPVTPSLAFDRTYWLRRIHEADTRQEQVAILLELLDLALEAAP